MGTKGFKAPELEDFKPYTGEKVDIFAAAVMLFMILTKHPPFQSTEKSDNFYKLLRENKLHIFWKAHSRGKPDGFFSEEFINLFSSLIAFDPEERPTIAQIRAHPWISAGPIATHEEIVIEFTQRKERMRPGVQKNLQKESDDE